MIHVPHDHWQNSVAVLEFARIDGGQHARDKCEHFKPLKLSALICKVGAHGHEVDREFARPLANHLKDCLAHVRIVSFKVQSELDQDLS